MDIIQSVKNSPLNFLALTDSQKWLIAEMQKFKRPGWACIEFLAKTKTSMDTQAMEKALYHLLHKYESLRAKIYNKDGQWVQEITPPAEINCFESYDLSNLTPPGQQDKIKQICMKTRDWLLPNRGNMVKVFFFKFSESEGRLWFCIHHVIADFITLLIFSSEFLSSYNILIQGKELKMETVHEFRKWLYLLKGYSKDVMLPSELDYWISLPWENARILPSDYRDKFYHDGIITEALESKKINHTYRTDTHWMDQQETLKVLAKFGVDLENLLLAVFFLAISKTLKMEWLDVSVSTSGRNILPNDYGINYNKVLGWVATVRAVLLKKPSNDSLQLEVENVIGQIKKIPNGGVGYFLISDFIEDESQKKSYLESRKSPGVLFNYLGRTDMNANNDIYEITEEDTGKEMHASEIRNILLDCVVGIKDNKLFIRPAFSVEYFKTETIDAIVFAMMSMVREISETKMEKIATTLLLK